MAGFRTVSGHVILCTVLAWCEFVHGAPRARWVADIHTDPRGEGAARSTPVAVSDQIAVFAGFDSVRGSELWVTDGTPAGTRLLIDIRTGRIGSHPEHFTLAGSLAFFTADDGVHGRELWATDGTEAGTRLVRDLEPGPGGSILSEFTAVGSGVWFVGAFANSPGLLWRTDGTSSGTVAVIPESLASQISSVHTDGSAIWFTKPVFDQSWRVSRFDPVSGQIFSPSVNILPEVGFLADGRAIFAASTAGLFDPWASDGSVAGTARILAIGGGTGSRPTGFTTINGWTVFAATSGTGSGRELWRTDGTAAGTSLLMELELGAGSGVPTAFARLGAFVYFAGYQSSSGVELWRTDGTPEGTALVADLHTGLSGTLINSSHPAGFLGIEGEEPILYFSATSDEGREIWRHDVGTGATYRVSDTPRPFETVNPVASCVVGGRLIFAAGGPHGAELLAVPLGGGGVECLAESPVANRGSNPTSLMQAGSFMYFAADSGGGATRALWITDGSIAGTRRAVADLNSIAPREVSVHEGQIFLSGYSQAVKSELFRFDASSGEVHLVEDLASPLSSDPFGLLSVEDKLYFIATVIGGPSLFAHDADAGSPTNLGTAVELAPWRTDSGVHFLKSISNEKRLWTTDGSVVGTQQALPHSISRALGEFHGRTMFLGSSPMGQSGLWSTDGTESGTALVLAGTFPNASPNPTSTQRVLQFEDGTRGFVLRFAPGTPPAIELWSVSGGDTEFVTRLPAAFAASRAVSYDVALQGAGLNGKVVFAFDDGGPFGNEVWVTDGTDAGTFMLRDVAPGSAGSEPKHFVVGHKSVYFAATNPEHGREMWVTDGTVEGTRRVTDIYAGSDSSSPGPGVVMGKRLFFAATDEVHGRELWALPLCDGDFNVNGVVNAPDLFEFLSAWFARDESADVNLSGSVTVSDLFDFLRAWFAGC